MFGGNDDDRFGGGNDDSLPGIVDLLAGNVDMARDKVDLAGVYSANAGNVSGCNNAGVYSANVGNASGFNYAGVHSAFVGNASGCINAGVHSAYGGNASGWNNGGAAAYGVCYGRKATRLPSTNWVLNNCKRSGFSKMLLPSIDDSVIPIIDAVSNDNNLSSKMKLVLWIDCKDLSRLANVDSAKQWVRKYIEGHESILSDICIGDVTGNRDFKFSIFENALKNLKHHIPYKASIKLSAVVNVSILEGNYRAETAPSKCKLNWAGRKLLGFLYHLNGGQFPLFVSVMPYFMISDSVTLDNCLLKYDDSVQPYMWDTHYSYTQAFDAMLDSICCALNKEWDLPRKPDLHVVSGWPTDGSEIVATRLYAKIYNNNLAKRVRASKCTPRNNKPAGIFFYSLVDEDMIDTDEEEFKHLGLVQTRRR